jgi:hypothetical protein
MKNIRKIISIVLLAVVIVSCGKENQYSNDFAAVAFVNASPAAPVAGFTVFVDTIAQGATIAYRSTTGSGTGSVYLSVRPGTRNIELRNVVNFQTVKYMEMPETTFETNTASTFFIYDTLSAANQKLKALRLSDDLSLPATGSVKVRFVPLAVNAAPMDVTFLRTSVTPNDSITLTNRSYVGANPNVSTLSAFTTIPLGTYTIKLKPTGTQTVSATAAATLNGGTGFYGIYSVYSTGTARGLPLAVSVVNHYR